MFSIVPFNLQCKQEAPSNVTISDVTGSSKLLVPGRATAATNIPQGAMTIPIKPELLSGRPDVVQIMVGTNTYGTMELDKSSKQIWCKNVHWVRALRLSDDCHSYNIQLKLESTPNKKIGASKLILQAVRPITVGQELMLWFSEDILALMQMVFLTPANIQGQKKYVCTHCSALYESPNPLKLHIILGCGRRSMSDLWDKLAKLLSETNKNDPIEHKRLTEFSFKLTPDLPPNKQKNAIDLSMSTISLDLKPPISQPIKLEDLYTPTLSPTETTALYRPYSEPTAPHSSAFKPFKKIQQQDDNKTKFLHPVRNFSNVLQWPNFSFNESLYTRNHILHNGGQQNDEAQIETLVSSLGKSKEGHVCLYCGKCYSRKYGLKIHIRTHTGYKPLKCKFCLRPFGDPSNLNKHVRLHAEGETPYRCELCGKILVRRRDLERHLKSRHMGEIHPGRSIVEERSTSEQDLTDEENEDVTVDR